MGDLRRLGVVLSLACGTAAAAGDAGLADFADCAGRYGATVEHLWLFDGPASEVAARRRDAFVDMLAAFAPDPGATARRADARIAQRALLDRATFARDAAAARIAREWLLRCDRLLPGA